jgi:hypothetical protein
MWSSRRSIANVSRRRRSARSRFSHAARWRRSRTSSSVEVTAQPTRCHRPQLMVPSPSPSASVTLTLVPGFGKWSTLWPYGSDAGDFHH